MKMYITFCIIIIAIATLYSKTTKQEAKDSKENTKSLDSLMEEVKEMELFNKYDSIEKTFVYQTGIINLEGIGQLNVPKGFKFLNAESSKKVIVEFWGNPSSVDATIGMLLPESESVLSDTSYVFNIEYESIGYVKDDDADDINYDDLLKEMQESIKESNVKRNQDGYESINLIGWASKPYYDKQRKILHWAKEVKFGKSEVNTLNYNVRILGRKGVLILNAISSMPYLGMVQRDIPKVIDIFKFKEELQYKNFNSSIDEVAAWTLGGLVAGKVLAKVGLFAVIAKFGKIIILAIIGFFSFWWKKIRGKSTDDSENSNS